MTSADRNTRQAPDGAPRVRFRGEGAPGTALFLFGAVLLVASLLGCGRPSPAQDVWSLSGQALGTTWNVKLVPQEGMGDDLQGVAQTRIAEELALVDAAMSTWRDDSEISLWNRAAEGEVSEISDLFGEVVRAAREVAERTGGAFDPTVAPLVRAWGFGAGVRVEDLARNGPPENLDDLRERVGWPLLTLDLDPGGSWILGRRSPGVELDLSGIAKGTSVDRISTALLELGFVDHLAEVGGEVVGRGVKPDGSAWTVGVERPTVGVREVQRAISLVDAAMATSGDYRNYREVAGERVSHLLDPRSGQPIRHRVASVSVIASTCQEADALATGLIVMGLEDGMELARREQLAVLFLEREGEGFVERASPAFEDYLAAAESTVEALEAAARREAE